MTQERSGPSFRDPDGVALVLQDRVRRFVRSPAWQAVQDYSMSPSARRLSDAGAILPWREADGTAAGQHGEAAIADAEDWAAVIDQDRVPFASYPHEWPAEMLHAAGALILDIHGDMLRDGYGLKDATPYNVLFQGSTPVHVDIFSAEARDAGDPLWLAEGQWIRTVVLPLLANRIFRIPTHIPFLTDPDGVRPESVYCLAGPLRRLMPGFFWSVTLPVWLSGRAESAGGGLYEARRMAPARAEFVSLRTLQRLRRRLDRLLPDERPSHWAQYDKEHNYSAKDAGAKEAFVRQSLQKAPTPAVLDLGCNVGRFSLLAASQGARVVAVDSDPVVVGRLWREASRAQADVQPLVVDISRPTPAMGWRNRECPSFLVRARKGFDVVLALALLHHLLVTARIPLAEIIDVIATLTTRFAVVEYVAPADDNFRRLCRGREHLHDGLTEAVFRAACEKHFDVVERLALSEGRRVLYLLSLK